MNEMTMKVDERGRPQMRSGCFDEAEPLMMKFGLSNKKHLRNVRPIDHCEPPHANSPDVASGTVARRLRIDVHDANDNDDDDNDNA